MTRRRTVASLLLLLFLIFSALVANPKKTTLHGGQSRSWSAEQGKKRKKEKVWQRPPFPPPRALLVRRKQKGNGQKWVYPPLFQTNVGGGKMQTSSPPVITPNRFQSNPDDMITLPRPIQSVGMDLHDVSGTSTGQTLPRERRAPPGTHFCPTIWWVYPPNCRTKVGARWSSSFPRQSLARRRARNIVQVHARALNGSWECYHVVRIGLEAIWGVITGGDEVCILPPPTFV